MVIPASDTRARSFLLRGPTRTAPSGEVHHADPWQTATFLDLIMPCWIRFTGIFIIRAGS